MAGVLEDFLRRLREGAWDKLTKTNYRKQTLGTFKTTFLAHSLVDRKLYNIRKRQSFILIHVFGIFMYELRKYCHTPHSKCQEQGYICLSLYILSL